MGNNMLNDYISRQAAIEALEKVAELYPWKVPGNRDSYSQYNEAWQDALDRAEGAIGNLPSAQPEVLAHGEGELSAQPEQRCIPCSERLPETHKAGNSVSGIFMESKPVLVYGVPEYESEYSFNVVTYCDDLNGNTYWSTEMDAVTINEVTAWMPLPEPYHADEEGNA